MKLRVASLSLFALCLTLAAVPAVAQLNVYDNGPVDGEDFAWAINFNSSVTDSFTLGAPANVNGLNFWAWLSPGDTLSSVEVQIGSTLFGKDLTDVTVNLTQSNCFSNQFNYNVCDESGTFTMVSLPAGRYWITLSNALVPNGDAAFWDENSGPSDAAFKVGPVATIPSESFTISGFAEHPAGTTPEPSNLVLFGSGVVALAGILRRRLF
jgi:hypothetical protein